jgi:hypothetical protein
MKALKRLFGKVCEALGCGCCDEFDEARLACLYVEDRKAWRAAMIRKHRLAA